MLQQLCENKISDSVKVLGEHVEDTSQDVWLVILHNLTFAPWLFQQLSCIHLSFKLEQKKIGSSTTFE
jgi:hypothetical protein